jgi:NADPH:quinone reductase-like Zn-dependent oxidoreductase
MPMKAVVITGYGGRDKLQLRNVEKPAPGPAEILLRVKAASLNPVDWKLRRGQFRFVWRLKFPFTPGFDVAGIVESTGQGVTLWKPGHEVYAALAAGGGHAEYVALDQSLCAAKPELLAFEEAAAIPGGALSALQALRDVANVRSGNHVVINGASGGVGTFAIQIAVALGCRVTAVTSARNLELVKSLGADTVIDYAREDVLAAGPCDVFFDVVPNRTFPTCARMLSANGTYVTTLPGPGPLMWKVLARAGALFGYRKKCGWLMIKPNGKDLQFTNSLIEEGKLRPVIDHAYALDEFRTAYGQSETGHARGKIVLRIN